MTKTILLNNSIELSALPIWVHIIGLPPTLFTLEAGLLVGETLGSVVQVDKDGIRLSDLVCVRISHALSNLVKQAFPPTEFEFSHGVVAVLSFRYDCVVGFCKVCGLLEHVLMVVVGCWLQWRVWLTLSLTLNLVSLLFLVPGQSH